MDYDYIECGDCLKLLKTIPDNSVDLILTDPPYLFDTSVGCGAFGSKKKRYHEEYAKLSKFTLPLDQRRQNQCSGLGTNLVDGFDEKMLR